MASYQHTTQTSPFASKIPCAAMIFPPLFQFAGAWRHPRNRSDWLRSTFWTDIGQQLEADGYDMLFVPDAMAMARGHDGSTDSVISTGAKGGNYLDPVTVMSTVHQLSNGRAGWNIVTSAYDYEAQNMGLSRLPSKPERYRLADRVVQDVLDIWASFPDEALLMDTETGQFADAARIRSTAQEIGPLTLPGDVRGNRPMLLQAGASPTTG